MDAIPQPEGLCGKRYIAYARCASRQRSTQSLRRQIRLVRQFGNHVKMRCVDEVRYRSEYIIRAKVVSTDRGHRTP